MVRIVGENLPFMRDQFSAWQQATLEEQVSFQNLIERIRKNIDVHTRTGPSGREQASFDISFQWNNQDIVAPVTNSIVDQIYRG